MRTLSALLAVLLILGTVPVGDTSGWVASTVRTAFTVRAASKVDERADERALEAMQLRVQTVFDRLARQIVLQHPDLAEYTIEPVIEKVPNAWINQKNEIYVTSGLLELLEEDDALAGVIGHEIAHGTQGHIPHRISQSLWSAFAVIALGTIASSQGGSDWGGLLHMRDLFMYAFSREQESEADLVGMRYARDAGYRPEGLVEALKAMDDQRRRLPQESVWQELYRTHPPMARRITDLRLILATEQLQKAPLQGIDLTGIGGTTIGAGAASPEEAALGFGRALLNGDDSSMRPYVLPGRAPDMLAPDMLALIRAQSGSNGDVGQLRDTHAGAVPTGEEADVEAREEPAWSDGDWSDTDWSDAELELIRRADANLSTILTIRLWRPATVAEVIAGLGTGRDGAEIASPPLQLTLQQSARGWIVTSWEIP